MIKNRRPHDYWIAIIFALISFTCTAQAKEPAGDEKLTLGLLPSRSTVNLFKRFAPLRDYLSEKMGRSIVFETAADYELFLQHSKKGVYDFILTAPHYALLTLDSGNYEVSAAYKNPLKAIILVHQQSKIKTLADLAGKKVSTPPTQAIITMAGKHFLSKSGLVGIKKPVYVLNRTHSASLHTILVKESDAAIISSNVTRHAIQKGYPVRKLAQSPDIPSMAWLASKKLPKHIRDQFGKLLISMDKTAEGQNVLKKINYAGYRKATSQDFEPVRPFLRMNW